MIYLASPYAHVDPVVRQRRFENACRAAAATLRRDHWVFSPIAHSHCIEVHGDGVDAAFDWLTYDRWFLDRCSYLWVLTLDGWEESKGVAQEIRWARELGIAVRYVPLADILKDGGA
jgi:hypothetical protein